MLGLALALLVAIGALFALPGAVHAAGTIDVPTIGAEGGGAAPSGSQGFACADPDCGIGEAILNLDLPAHILEGAVPVQTELIFIYQLVRWLAFTFAGLAIAWAGLLFITSGSSVAGRAQAKDLIQRTVTGLIMIGMVPLFFTVLSEMRLVSSSLSMDSRPRILIEEARIEVTDGGSIPASHWRALSQTTGNVSVGVSTAPSRMFSKDPPMRVELVGSVRAANLGGHSVYVRGDILEGAGDSRTWHEGGWFAPRQVSISGGQGTFRVDISEQMIQAMLVDPGKIVNNEPLAEPPKPVRVVVYAATPGSWSSILGREVSSFVLFQPVYLPQIPTDGIQGNAIVRYTAAVVQWVSSLVAKGVTLLSLKLVSLAFRPVYLDDLPPAAAALWQMGKALAQIGLLLVATLWTIAYITGRRQSVTQFLQQVFLALIGINAAPFFIQRLLDLNTAIVNSLFRVAAGGRGMETALLQNTSGWQVAGDLIALIVTPLVALAIAVMVIVVALRYIIRYLEIAFWALASPIVFTVGAYQGMNGSAVRTFTSRTLGAIFMQTVDSFILSIVIALSGSGFAGTLMQLAGLILMTRSTDLARELLGLDTSMSTGTAISQGIQRAGAAVIARGFSKKEWVRAGVDAVRSTAVGGAVMKRVDDTINRIRARQAVRQEAAYLQRAAHDEVRAVRAQGGQPSAQQIAAMRTVDRLAQRVLHTPAPDSQRQAGALGAARQYVQSVRAGTGRLVDRMLDRINTGELADYTGTKLTISSDTRVELGEISRIDRGLAEQLGEARAAAVHHSVRYRDQDQRPRSVAERVQMIERQYEKKQKEEKQREKEQRTFARQVILEQLRQAAQNRRHSQMMHTLTTLAREGRVSDFHIHFERMQARVAEKRAREEQRRARRGGGAGTPPPG